MSLIANPQRTLVINFPIEKVKRCAKQVYKIYSDIKMSESKFDDIINIYKYSCNDHWTAGSWLVLTMVEISENKTQITLEMQRFFGAYDTEAEVNFGHMHMNKFLEALSSLLGSGEEEFVQLEKTFVEEKSDAASVTIRVILLVLLVGLIIFVLAIAS